MVARVQGQSHPRYVRALGLRASAEATAAQFDAATLDLDRARTIVAQGKADPAPAFRAFDLIAAKMDYLRGDYAQLRKHLAASIAITQSSGSAAPVLFAWFALSCEHSPGEGCGSDDVERARQILADPKFAHDPDQLPARNALARIDLLHGDANKAIEEVQQGLTIALPEVGEKHSWVGEAHLLLGDANDALHDAAAAEREYASAAAIANTSPPGHPLRIETESRLARKRQPASSAAPSARQSKF